MSRSRGRFPLVMSSQVFVTLAIGLVGALSAQRFAFPGGAFTGALLATAIARLLEGPLEEPPKWLQVCARIILGLTIGAMVTPDTLHTIALTAAPVTVAVLAMTGLGIAVAWGINWLTGMALPTALCAATPGLLSAMVALADDLDADRRIVASMHLVRVVSILVLVPVLVRALVARGNVALTRAPLAATEAAGGDPARLCALLLLGLAAGFLAWRFRIPAGDLLASLAVAAVINPAWLRLVELPASWRLFAQWIVGAGVGATVTRSTLRDFRAYALAGGLMTALLIAAGLVLAWVLSLTTSLDLMTCIIGSVPGGAAPLIILADSLGANAQLVAAMHVSRQIILVLLLPALARTATRRGLNRSPVVSAQDPPDAPSTRRKCTP